ncbi:endolytic transglycosylase MltG [Streptomyces caniscabiei]|uniref:endolytic transglycosylase MltG n=1 Tax=Streptomyces caniscabiei TaxID=2746961 RepID=UPI0029B20E7B|nr:endolytic transglycosylase MltG [Streptomyces caniscabiei]MDX2776700.1 endolytic transglycosylase MltG [Streptomyces caniscabiei]
MKKIIAWIVGIVLALLVLAAGAAYVWYQDALNPVSSAEAEKVRVRIDSGSTFDQIGKDLEDKKLIRSSLAFTLYARMSGAHAKLQAGTYSLSPNESTQQIMNHLTSGNVDQFSITFLPGATLAENRAGLIKAGYSEAEVDAALNKTYQSPLFEDKPAGTDLEGYIYGETYTFSSDVSVEGILEEIFKQFYSVLTENNLITGLKSHGLNLYQAITLASIIQREEPNPEAQRQVAQVFYLRLAKDMPLGSDVTAYYGADKIGAERSVAVDTPYNTRIHKGMPPGPIATPGLTALQAVADPAAGDFLYFVSGDDDVTYFSRTVEEHEKNAAEHCKIKCSIP